MATNHETTKASSSKPAEENPLSAVGDASLVTTETLRQRVENEIGKNETGQAGKILIRTVQNLDRDRNPKREWSTILGVAIVIFISYVIYATWQWHIKISGVTSQLLQKGNVDAIRVLLAVSDLSSQGERSFFITFIIGLIICVVVWLGWTKYFQSSKTQAVENATRMLTVVAEKESKVTGLTAIVTLCEAQMEDLKLRKKALDEEIEVLRNSDRVSQKKMEKLYEKRREIEEELKKKSVELEETKETVQHQAECMQKAEEEHAQEIEEEKLHTQQLKTQISKCKAELDKERALRQQVQKELDKERALRQQVQKELEAEQQKVEELKKELQSEIVKKRKWWFTW